MLVAQEETLGSGEPPKRWKSAKSASSKQNHIHCGTIPPTQKHAVTKRLSVQKKRIGAMMSSKCTAEMDSHIQNYKNIGMFYFVKQNRKEQLRAPKKSTGQSLKQ